MTAREAARPTRARAIGTLIAVLCALAPVAAGAQAGPPAERIDWLTFANGAFPIRIGGAGATMGANMEHAIRIVDGSPDGFTIVSRATDETVTEFVYELPAPTTFDRFAVPDVLETPSPAQTFTRRVEVHGSASGPEGGWVLLAAGDLATHAGRGRVTELEIAATTPVRWVRVRLIGGIQILRPESFLEFSEIIGNGTQEAPALADVFTGAWRGTGVRLRLRQEGPLVAGCYDGAGDLEGTVSGTILRATGEDRTTKVASLFVLSITPEGEVRGLRSTNGAPFRLYAAPAAAEAAVPPCADPAPPVLGCGSVIHGINFDFDSAVIRPESGPVLEQLFRGLSGDPGASILIEGHTSSEGSEDYNRGLSERRAAAVVGDLVRRGIPAGRLRAAGAGESRPIAPNDDETGRSLNRRVEVRCTGGRP